MAIDDGPVIVGGGPSGLAAAIELRELGISPVTVIEREREAGGIPRHSDHTGFGLRDLRTVLSGPRYAARYRELAEEAAVEVLTETMVTEWEGERSLELTGPSGRWEIEPPAVVLATGCRERPRSARLVPGSRPAGVMTTATLQQLVHLRGRKVGQARGDSRRRARQLLGGRHACPRRRLGRGPGHGAAAAPVAADLPGRGGRPLPGARLDAHQGERHPRRRAGRVGRADRAGLGAHPDRRVRPGDLHRRLDPRPRARRDGRLRARFRDARAAGRPRAPHHAARRVRGGEPASSCRDRRCLRARRPPRGPGGGRLPARSRRVALRCPDHLPEPAGVGGSEPGAGDRPLAAAGPLPAPLSRVRLRAPGFTSARTAASSGAAAWGASCRDARRTSRLAGRPRSIPTGAP